MQPAVETLSGLERRLNLVVSMANVEKEVQAQLRRVARTAKAPGFRPGKVPMAMLERTHAPGIRYDVINTQVAQAFEQAVDSAKLRVAGQPNLEPIEADGADKDAMAFTATFEVYPEVKVPDLSALSVTRWTSPVTDKEIENTIEVLRKQRATYEARDGRAVVDGDRVTLDFAGTIDGTPFDGGKAEDFSFVAGQGRMLPEFEEAAKGMKAGESKVFPLAFPEDYQGKDVAGKTAEFTVTIKEVAEPVLPAVDAEFAKSLGQAEGDVEKLRSEIRANVEREAKARLASRVKNSVMDALAKAAEFDLPKSLVASEVQSRVASAREELKRRGLPNADSVPVPEEMFKDEAERRVRLGLLVGELVRDAGLQAKPEQVRSRIEELAQSYESPAQVVNYYLSDRQRRAEVEAIVLEDNVVEHVLGKATVTEEVLPFDELMGIGA